MDTNSDSDDESSLELFLIVTNEHLNTIDVLHDNDELSVILRAIVEEDLDKVRQMIESGESVNTYGNNGNTPLHVAVIRNNLEILEYLLTREDLILNVRNFEGETPLYTAVKLGLLQSATKLVHAGADINLPNTEKASPLHISVRHPEIAHLLIRHGAKIDAVDYCGETPLHDAVEEKQLETVCMFLYYNADANSLGSSKWTPFMQALSSKDIDIQQALFEYVDDFNLTTADHLTTLALALIHNTIYVEEIIRRGANVNYIDLYEDKDEDVMCPFLLCLIVPNPDNFKLIWQNIHFNPVMNTVDLCLLFEYLDRCLIEEYIQCIIESDNINLAVDSFMRNGEYFIFINKFAKVSLKLEQLTQFTCCLLQYGYRTTSYDIYVIFSHYGFCDLIKTLLFMDNDFRPGWAPCMTVPRLMFDLNVQINRLVAGDIYNRDVYQLLQYFIYPPLMRILMIKYRDDEVMTSILGTVPRVPSLIELGRNATRAHILNSFKVTSTCQLCTIINHLNISSVYKKILLFETKLYQPLLPVTRDCIPLLSQLL